eukprot:scaffold137230_cov18-Tisochrysis_lutea.AAC.1
MCTSPYLSDFSGFLTLDRRNELILDLPGSLLGPLALGEYTVSLTVESWLGKQGRTEHTFTKQVGGWHTN